MSSRIVDYMIIRGENHQHLTSCVMVEMEKGWQPLGGAFELPDGHLRQTFVGQTMVMYEDMLPSKGIPRPKPNPTGTMRGVSDEF